MMVTVVAGPPAAGKTTWVRERAKPGDLIVDWDEILSALTGLPAYTRPEQITYYANVAAKAVLTALGRATMRGRIRPEAWVIRSWPKPGDRTLAATPLPIGLGARVVVLPCPAAVCHARIDADPLRAPTAEAQHAAVTEWWAAYAPASCDHLDDAARSGG